MTMRAKAGILIVIALILIPAVVAEDEFEWVARAQNAATAGDYTDALTYYNNALSVNPSYSPALAGKAAALNQLGKYQDALDSAGQALSIQFSTTAQNAQAYALFKLGRYNDAITAYLNLTAVQTNHADAYCNLASSYFQVGMPDKALSAYAQCTNLDPNNPDTWNQIGLVYMSENNYTDALDAFNHATRFTTTNAEIWNNKGEALAALGQYQDALGCFNTALTINPAYTEAEQNREAVIGKAQIIQITGSPTPTQAPWVLASTRSTTVPVAGATPSAATQIVPPQTSMVTTVATEIPIVQKTTYTPLSPFDTLAALLVAGLFTAIIKCGRKH